MRIYLTYVSIMVGGVGLFCCFWLYHMLPGSWTASVTESSKSTRNARRRGLGVLVRLSSLLQWIKRSARNNKRLGIPETMDFIRKDRRFRAVGEVFGWHCVYVLRWVGKKYCM